MTDFTAETLYRNGEAARDAAQRAVYQAEVARCRGQAATLYRDVIYPWWGTFVGSQAALDLALLLPGKAHREARLSQNVCYRTTNGAHWEAYIVLRGDVRHLHLAVRQLPGGREANSMAGNIQRKQLERAFPLKAPELPNLDLHPVVIVDFAEQIEVGIVDAIVRRHLRGATPIVTSGRRPAVGR